MGGGVGRGWWVVGGGWGCFVKDTATTESYTRPLHDALPVCHEGKRGHQVLCGRHFWPALAKLREGDGARAIVGANREAVHLVDVDDPGIWRDVDTPQDLEGSEITEG